MDDNAEIVVFSMQTYFNNPFETKKIYQNRQKDAISPFFVYQCLLEVNLCIWLFFLKQFSCPFSQHNLETVIALNKNCIFAPKFKTPLYE